MMDGPKTLLEAVQHFKSEDNCIRHLAAERWPDRKVKCPTCGSDRIGYLENQKRWQCSNRHPKRQFSIKVGTIMEDSPIGLDKWLPVLWLISNCRNGISSWEIHRALGVTQKTAWFMLHRVRLAMQDDLTGGMLGGEVEVDESYIGGKVRFMHKGRKRRAQAESRSLGNKTIVLGLLERETEKRSKRVRATIIADRSRPSIREEVRAHVEKGSQIHSDEHAFSWRMDDEYTHNVINHAECYVNGQIHTNGLEKFLVVAKARIGRNLY
jgi:transposase-like protein